MNSGNAKAGSLSPQFNRYFLDLTGMHIKKAQMAATQQLIDFNQISNEKTDLTHISSTHDWSSFYQLLPFHKNGLLA